MEVARGILGESMALNDSNSRIDLDVCARR